VNQAALFCRVLQPHGRRRVHQVCNIPLSSARVQALHQSASDCLTAMRLMFRRLKQQAV
jgi:hypothetical protein